ncbi:Uncharacterized protein FKW44_013537 [Caligus rogercresseyi]|uniref:Mariner Mos1 transposase n=1 Tax=Caligus rogercresseyi TaxID=217165 RepID=A0A7T8GYB3_CALRO|nr:Uncharacterized protein FKW44_013537 [Caligus rogercresseyi]
MLETVNGDPDFMNTVITGDESWVYGMTQKPSASQHSGSILHPRGQKSKASSQQCQGHAYCLFDSSGLVHHEYAPHGTTITKEYTKRFCVAFVTQ